MFEELVVPFEEGDIFFFYSDGVTEARNEAGVMFGEQRVASLIRENCGVGAERSSNWFSERPMPTPGPRGWGMI